MTEDQVVEVVFDLTTIEGLQECVEAIHKLSEETIFHARRLPFASALFAHVNPHTREDYDVPTFVAMLHPARNAKELRTNVRKHALPTQSIGAMMLHIAGRRVVFQVEHRELGDLAWHAGITEDFLLSNLKGPFPIDRYDLKPLTALPERYMS